MNIKAMSSSANARKLFTINRSSLKIDLHPFTYVFLREATGGHSWRPWEYHSQLLLINFLMFSYGRPREATGGHGNTARALPIRRPQRCVRSRASSTTVILYSVLLSICKMLLGRPGASKIIQLVIL